MDTHLLPIYNNFLEFNSGSSSMCPILLPINTKDEIYNINAIACDKRTWICKSMGNSQFHDMSLTYYGEERLRYIYLIRDCHDVALSFM